MALKLTAFKQQLELVNRTSNNRVLHEFFKLEILVVETVSGKLLRKVLLFYSFYVDLFKVNPLVFNLITVTIKTSSRGAASPAFKILNCFSLLYILMIVPP